MSIGSFSVKNRVLINLAIITILVLGAFSLQRLPREQFSEVPFFWVNVLVAYPGVSAEDVEQSVTVPVENELKGMDSLKRIQSVTSEGLSVVRVEFDDGISNDEFQRLFQDVRTRFSRVALPDDTLPALIDDFSSSDFLPVIEVIVSGDADYGTLAAQADLLAEQLKGVDQVSGLDVVGLRERQIVINADRTRLEALGVSLNEIIRAVSLRNVTVPGGTVQTDSREYLLRTVGELENVEDFEELIIRRSGGSSGMIRVRDVAGVADTYNPRGIYARYNGREAIVLRVAKVPRGNSIGVIQGVKDQVADFEASMPPGMSIDLTGDSTVQIRDSIRVLLNNALMGLVLLTLILFLFIGLRNALMTALGIPITFAITFVALELLGETFNTNTLFAMVLVLGLIVDHAIVITENSFRLQQEGLSKRQAAIQGTDQVVLPVVAATATTIAAFLPLMILPGTIGKFLRVIPLTVSLALAASTFEAAVFLPSHFADWPGGNKIEKAKDRFAAVRRRFTGILSSLYGRKKIMVPLLVVIMLGSFALVPLLQQDLFSAEDFTLFHIDLELSPGTPREKTNRVVAEYEEKILPLLGNGEVVSVISSVGFSSGGGGNTAKSNVAQIVVDLTERDEGRARSIAEIMDEVRYRTAEIPGTEEVLFRKATNGPPTDPPVSFRLFGDNNQSLSRVSDEMTDLLATYPDLLNIEDNLEVESPELQVVLKEERASALGIDALTLGTFLRDTYEGRKVTTFFRDNQEIDVLVRYQPGEDLSALALDQLLIPLADGRNVPFSSVADIRQGDALAGIKRVDGRREITITAEAYSNENLRSINKDIRTYFDTRIKPVYPEIELVVGGEFTELGNLLIQILRVFLLGIFLIYIILGTRFQSYLQPLLILITIPFAFVGVILYLFISGTPFSTTVLYAGVALAGIAVNDSIVLVSFINEQRKKGMRVAEAVLSAADTRLRPILLTTLTTIAGLLPTALGLGGVSVVWGPMAGTIIFGLFFSTLTALFFIPLLYGLLFDRKGRMQSSVEVSQ